MKSDEYHILDRCFTLLVEYEDEEISIGFAGFEWHTHGDLLAAHYPPAASPKLGHLCGTRLPDSAGLFVSNSS